MPSQRFKEEGIPLPRGRFQLAGPDLAKDIATKEEEKQ